jgi:tripartite ATP-independent transporter DctM subunit
VGKLFLGGILPGLLMVVLFSVYIAIRCGLNPKLGPPIQKESLARELAEARAGGYSKHSAIMPLLLITVMFVAMYSGIATPTEAAAGGALAAMLIGVVNGRIRFHLMNKAGLDTVGLTAMIMWVTLGGIWLSSVYQGIGASQLVGNFFEHLDLGPWGTLLLIQLVWFVLGCLLDPTAIMFMTMPLFYPLIVQMGFDPVWFGILFIINMELSYLTPPFGLNLFYLKAVAPPDISMGQIIRSCLPFLAIQLIVLVLTMIFPQIILFLPDLAIN